MPGAGRVLSLLRPAVDWSCRLITPSSTGRWPCPGAHYFATRNYTEEWTRQGQTFLMSFWRRPQHAMTCAFTGVG